MEVTTMNVKELNAQMDDLVSNGRMVDAVKQFYSESAASSDYGEVTTGSKQQMVEKMEDFIDKHDYKFKFAYDYDSEIFKLLKLQNLGIPVTLIIDKEQNIRIQHVGYNPAETNFSKNMIETINSLM